MALPLIPLVIIGSLITVTLAWPYIRDFFAKTIIPLLRHKLSPGVADVVAKVIVWIDTPVSMVRAKVKELYRAFKQRVLGLTSTLEQTSSRAGRITTESFVNEDGKLIKISGVEEISLDDPRAAAFRKKMIQHNVTSATEDLLGTIDNAAVEATKQMGDDPATPEDLGIESTPPAA